MKSQRFVLAKPLECGLSLSIDLAPGGDAAKGLKRVAAGYDLEWGTLGIGEPLTMALHSMGYPAISLSGAQAGIRTDGAYSRARITNIDPKRVVRELEKGNIVIVAGFQGITDEMDVTTLGRGGSDTTAVALAAALKADDFRVDEVTAAYGISRNHVAKIIHRLAQLGYLETRRGRGGGIRLAQPAAEIRIGKLVRQTEAQPVLVECFDPKTNTCPVSGSCYLKGALGEAMNAFYATLDRHTLESITTGPKRLALVRTLLPAPHAHSSEAKTGNAKKISAGRT